MRSGEPLSPAELRERVGLTQRQVAVAMNKRESTISDWERGISKPRLSFTETLRLARLYQCSVETLAIVFDRIDPDDI